ncbi:uncharacterized protein B0I36DRAFT_356404 [Microdochium trichocladiopsis]|uniref:Uncharacterized protein n=1 Tax=Microdochium trichocladiopsis TaxID=1682393 RepID=A0A9P8XT87_9PEZI|nr:uncharacterized protein B0I36DRAFT_356404 [Microdochium trichocladiopsis]KAH7010785.1 hypothetical protein B0I36DRAFT_356404 [Microdochium trichocladiopsis]
MLEYIATVTRRKYYLRTEPKVKNHIGPDVHIYLSHFRWVRDWKNVFKIGLDRLDDATLRYFQMFTGARPHEFVHARIPNDYAIKMEYHDELDAFTDTDEEGDVVPPQGPCWVCGENDDRTHAAKKVLCWEDIKLWIIRDPFNDGGRDRLVRWKREFMHTLVFRQTIKSLEGYVKSNEPLRKDQLDNNSRNLGRAAGLLDNLTNYDYRRGNLEAIDDAFLGRGTKSPYLAIFNQLGLQIDEDAPTVVTDEMMRFLGPGIKILRLDDKVATLRTSLE